MITPNNLNYSLVKDPAGFWEVTCDKSDRTGAIVFKLPCLAPYEDDEPSGMLIDLQLSKLEAKEAYEKSLQEAEQQQQAVINQNPELEDYLSQI